MISENDIQDYLGHADIERAIAWEMQRETLGYIETFPSSLWDIQNLWQESLAIQNLNLAISRGI